MKIHLSKPGGKVEGPFTLEKINRDLAANLYHEDDYWAWHEGLTDWVPLHSIPGLRGAVEEVDDGAGSESEPGYPADGTELMEAAEEQAVSTPEPEPAASEAQSSVPPSLAQQLFSGMPFSALEQVFILTSGEGQAASHSTVTAGMLEAITGESMDKIREAVPRHVLAGCAFLQELRKGGSNPDAALRAVATLNPDLVRQAREGLYRVCVRTFPTEIDDVVGLFLFYNKQKL